MPLPPPADSPPLSRLAVLARNPRSWAVLGIAALLLVAWQSGLFAWLAQPEALRDWLRDSGPIGPVLYVLLFTLVEPMGVPGIVLVGPATQIWPYGMVVGLSIAGAVGAGCVSYVVARWIARDWVQARLPERIRRLTDDAEAHPLRTVILVRMLFFLAAPAHWALGVSRIPPVPFLVGSIIGFTPPMVLFVYLIDQAIDLLGGRSPAVAILLLGAAVFAFLGFRAWRKGYAQPDTE